MRSAYLKKIKMPHKTDMPNYTSVCSFLMASIFSFTISHCYWCAASPSVLWRCWLGGRKGIRPVKTEWCGAGVVICLERCVDLHTAQLMPLPLAVSCFSKIQIGFTFLVLAHLGSPGQRAVKLVCVWCAAEPNHKGSQRESLKKTSWSVTCHAVGSLQDCLWSTTQRSRPSDRSWSCTFWRICLNL